MKKPVSKKYIIDLVKLNPRDPESLRRVKSAMAERYHTTIITNSAILQKYMEVYKTKQDRALPQLLRKRAIRTLSGIAPITVLTKPYPCPGRCIYCPVPKDMPKSYIKTEPAAQRALLLKFDPYKQVKQRIESLEANGHSVDKIELIVLGGTWSFYKKQYQTWFIKRCFEAANGRAAKSLAEAQRINQKAKHRIIGLSLETRPDYVTTEELWRMRKLGCTHVQIGVQTLHQDVLDLVKRDDTLKNMARATALLRDFGFKFTYHIMPGLPGSTPRKDLAVFKKLFTDPRFQPDMLKIYPCVVLKFSTLFRWYKQGKYKPYSDKQLSKLLVQIKKIIPPYVRINRLIRDIPGPDIAAGNRITNLRQLLHNQGVECKCIRCREVRAESFRLKDVSLMKRQYRAGDGMEYFTSFESKNKKKLYAFIRLRLPEHDLVFKNSTAFVRELHTYGELMPIGSKQKKVQHAGLGKRLMQEAEKIAKQKGYKRVAVISGIGVREYYKKLGYRLKKTYMVKELR